MAPNNNIEETIVRLREDRAARIRLIRGIGDVEKRIRGLGTTADKELDRRFTRSVDSARKQLRFLGQEADRTSQKIKNITPGPDAGAFGGLEGGGFGSGGNKQTIAAGVAIRNLPAIGPSETIAKVTTTLGRAGVSLTQVGVVAAAAIPTMIALKLAFDGFNATIEKSAAVFRDVVAARREVARITANSTREEVEAARKAAAEKLKIQQAELQQLLADRLTVSAQLNQQGLIGRALNVIGEAPGGGGPLGELRGAIEELNAEISATITLEQEYTQALDDNRTAVADAIALERARQAEFDAGQRKRLGLLREFASSSDIEGLDKRIDKLKEERTVLADFLETENLSTELTAALRQEYVDLNQTIGALSGQVRAGVKARADEAAALEKIQDVIKGVKDRLKEAAVAFEKVQEAASKIKDLRADFDLKIKDILRRGQQRIQDAEQDRLDSIADAQFDATEDQKEALREAGQERVEIERDSAREIARIRRRSLFDEQNAIQSRNAVALDSALRRRKLETTEANEDAKDRLSDLKRSLAEQQRTIRRALDNQIRIARVRYSRQVRDAGIAAQRAIAVEREKFQRELSIRVQALQAALGIQVKGETQRTQIAAAGAGQRLRVEGNFVQASLNLWSQAIRAISGASAVRQPIQGGSTNTGGSPNLRGFSPTAFHQGGDVARGGLAVLKRGERVINPALGQSAGGITVNMNIQGATVRTIRAESKRQIEREFSTLIDELGVAS